MATTANEILIPSRPPTPTPTPTMAIPLSLPLLTFIAFLFSLTTSTTIPIHQTFTSSSTKAILDLLDRDSSRLLFLSSLATTTPKTPPRHKSFIPIAPGRTLLNIPNYVVHTSLGSSPGQPLLAAIDTSNDAAWFPCSGCIGCSSTSPSFTTSNSSSFHPLPCSSPQCTYVPNPTCAPSPSPTCSFNLSYGSSSILASLVQDTITLSPTDVIDSYTFGCMQAVTGTSVPAQGLLGFGRGPLSFMSQTMSLYSGVFSYCLPSYKSTSFSGTLRLGTVGQPVTIKTTPLLSNPRRSSFYYVNMIGIRIGKKIVDIPPSALAFNAATGAGTIVDSGTMFTRLVAPAYVAVRDEFRKRVVGAVGPVTSLGGFDTCYNGAITIPNVTLMFTGMNVTLLPDNLMIHSSSGTLSCLAMAAAPDNVNSVLNVIANMQQQNMRVLFDVPNGRIGFAREACTAA